MRKSAVMVGIPVTVVGLGIAGYVGVRSMNKTAGDPFANDLKAADAAGIQLATAQTSSKYSLSEIAPDSKPEPKTTIRKGAGTKAVRSKAPTVKAAPEATVADVEENLPDQTVMAATTAPVPTPVPVAVNPEPAPQQMPAPATDQGPILRGGSGAGAGTGSAGSGGGWGTIFGAIIRGGGVDGDNCDPRGGRVERRGGTQMPVYNPNPAGMGGARTGGFGGRVGGMTAGGRTTVQGRPRGGR
jgi:hypothetical protein